MLKNKNIFISLQIEKNLENDALVLNIHFNSNAPNFSIENDVIYWNPTFDEIDFVSEVVNLLTNQAYKGMTEEPSAQVELEDEQPSVPQTPQSEDSNLEKENDSDIAPRLSKTEKDEKIFIQADEKKIDEIIKRKKAGFGEEYVIESPDKSRLDRMLKQKKKKE